MRSSDVAGTFVSQVSSAAASGELGFHQGLVLSWNAKTGANLVRIAGTDVPNVDVIASAGMIVLGAGDPVMVLRYKSKYMILGRVTGVSNPLVQPQWPIVLYPKFIPVGTAGNDFGNASVNASVTTSYEGRIRVTHPRIEVDGLWGIASGSGTVTYQLRLDFVVIGQWSLTNTSAVNHASVLAGLTAGGFDCSAFLGRDWLRIDVLLSSNGNSTGQTLFQPLGVFFRQTQA